MNAVAAASDASASTRDRLIDAAIVFIATHGLEAASVKSIAQAAAVTPGLVHYHFPSKDAMLDAALRRAAAAYLARIAERRIAAPRHLQTETLFAEVRRTASADLDFFRVRLALATHAIKVPALAATLAELNAGATAEIALVFATAAGRDAAGARDEAVASAVLAALDGIMLATITDPAFAIGPAVEILERAAIGWVEEPRLI